MALKGRTSYLLAWVAVGAAVWLYVERREVVARFKAYQANDAQVGEAAAKTADLNEELAATQEHVKNLHSNPLEMESAIRRAKGLVKPGEIVYRIMDDNSVTVSTLPAPDSKPVETSKEAPQESPKETALEAINPEMD